MANKIISDIINMGHIDLDNTYIGIEQSDRYIDLVRDMSDFIDTLDMPYLEKTKLISKLVEHDKAVRYDAMIQTLTDKLYIRTADSNQNSKESVKKIDKRERWKEWKK